MEPISHAIQEHQAMITGLHRLVPQIQRVAERMTTTLRQGGVIYWLGNGGSAADCQHLAAELVGRYTRERRGLASVALTTDTSILTAVGNDYGYDTIFARQVEALCRPGDLVVGITTSGNSPNVLLAMARARELGAFTVGLAGRDGGRLKEGVEECLIVSSPVTARVQEGHILIGHILCDLVEAAMMAARD